MNTSNNNISEFIKESFKKIWQFLKSHLRVVIPIAILIVLVIATAVGTVMQNKKDAEEAKKVAATAATVTETASAAIEIPDVPLEKNANADINKLFESYYKAMTSGDIDSVKKLNNNVDETEKIRISETAKYIDKYDKIDVYTKSGPVKGTYLAYVYSMVKFKDYDDEVPGMQAYYVCTDKNGGLYIEENEQDESVINYIREVSLQDDVVDLNNKVAVSYNDMIAKDSDLSKFLLKLSNDIDVAVGETLAQAESTEAGDTTETESTEETASQTAETTAVAAGTKVQTTDVVNVRSSDSETADKLGKAQIGDTFELKQEKENGWSEIDYNGTDAYIKTEFLKKVTETADSSDDTKKTDDTQDKDDTAKTDDSKSTDTKNADTDTTSTNSFAQGSTVTVKETVRIRGGASTDSMKLGSAYKGDHFKVLMQMQNGWVKIDYNGKTGYIKADFLE
ncbi:MAG: SH3 domain-containing protein [Lachnospiraceae bacterium]|mgnify:CR=1 FL=1|jgi:uncharacterized protein YgiM (DUF1202 family)|nr:SH3 domain-containing protein [Lachnospiraceae bacterium]